MDLISRSVRRGGERVALQPREFALLEYLLRSESLHDSLLEQLAEFKRDMTRASGG